MGISLMYLICPRKNNLVISHEHYGSLSPLLSSSSVKVATGEFSQPVPLQFPQAIEHFRPCFLQLQSLLLQLALQLHNSRKLLRGRRHINFNWAPTQFFHLPSPLTSQHCVCAAFPLIYLS